MSGWKPWVPAVWVGGDEVLATYPPVPGATKEYLVHVLSIHWWNCLVNILVCLILLL